MEPVYESPKTSSPLPAKRERRKSSVVAEYENDEPAETPKQKKEKKDKKKPPKKPKAEAELPPPQSVSVTLKPKSEAVSSPTPELASQVETLEQKKALLESQLELLRKEMLGLQEKKESLAQAPAPVVPQGSTPPPAQVPVVPSAQQTIVTPPETYEEAPPHEITQSITIQPKPKKEYLYLQNVRITVIF